MVITVLDDVDGGDPRSRSHLSATRNLDGHSLEYAHTVSVSVEEGLAEE